MTDIIATLIDNFCCDINLLSIQTHVIEIDLSDHFVIELQLNVTSSSHFIMKRSFSTQNIQKFSVKLCTANRDSLVTINNTDAAFIYFLKKFKRIYNESFPYKM